MNATGPAGATVSFSVTASDPDDGSSTPSVTCTPPASGDMYPIGTTTVNCIATDVAGNSTSGSFQVEVKDITAPTLVLPPSPLTVHATGSSSSVNVTYTVTASDPDNRPDQLTITCAPPSGSAFTKGTTTTVTCTAKDPAGNSSNGSFSVVVR